MHLYDPKMERDFEAAGLVRSGVPGEYQYHIINNNVHDSQNYLSWNNAFLYCSWKNNSSLRYILNSSKEVSNLDRELKSNIIYFSLLSEESDNINCKSLTIEKSPWLTYIGALAFLMGGGEPFNPIEERVNNDYTPREREEIPLMNRVATGRTTTPPLLEENMNAEAMPASGGIQRVISKRNLIREDSVNGTKSIEDGLTSSVIEPGRVAQVPTAPERSVLGFLDARNKIAELAIRQLKITAGMEQVRTMMAIKVCDFSTLPMPPIASTLWANNPGDPLTLTSQNQTSPRPRYLLLNQIKEDYSPVSLLVPQEKREGIQENAKIVTPPIIPEGIKINIKGVEQTVPKRIPTGEENKKIRKLIVESIKFYYPNQTTEALTEFNSTAKEEQPVAVEELCELLASIELANLVPSQESKALEEFFFSVQENAAHELSHKQVASYAQETGAAFNNPERIILKAFYNAAEFLAQRATIPGALIQGAAAGVPEGLARSTENERECGRMLGTAFGAGSGILVGFPLLLEALEVPLSLDIPVFIGIVTGVFSGLVPLDHPCIFTGDPTDERTAYRLILSRTGIGTALTTGIASWHSGATLMAAAKTAALVGASAIGAGAAGAGVLGATGFLIGMGVGNTVHAIGGAYTGAMNRGRESLDRHPFSRFAENMNKSLKQLTGAAAYEALSSLREGQEKDELFFQQVENILNTIHDFPSDFENQKKAAENPSSSEERKVNDGEEGKIEPTLTAIEVKEILLHFISERIKERASLIESLEKNIAADKEKNRKAKEVFHSADFRARYPRGI